LKNQKKKKNQEELKDEPKKEKKVKKVSKMHLKRRFKNITNKHKMLKYHIDKNMVTKEEFEDFENAVNNAYIALENNIKRKFDELKEADKEFDDRLFELEELPANLPAKMKRKGKKYLKPTYKELVESAMELKPTKTMKKAKDYSLKYDLPLNLKDILQ
jgi:hypothetical protein